MDLGDRGRNPVAMTIMAKLGIEPATSCSQVLYARCQKETKIFTISNISRPEWLNKIEFSRFKDRFSSLGEWERVCVWEGVHFISFNSLSDEKNLD